MNSSNNSTTTSAASASGENSTSAFSEHEKFFSTYFPNQLWSLPDSIIYYISKNPLTAKIYEKMIQSCKYFFIQNSLLVVSDLNVKYEKYHWNTLSLNEKNVVDLNRVSSNLWITDELCIDNDTPIIPPPNPLQTVLTKIYQCDAKKLFLQYQKIYITDLQKLASKCEKVALYETTVINEDNSVIGLEKIIEVLNKIERFINTFSQNFVGTSANVITHETVKKLIQIPHFPNLECFSLSEIPEIFDIDTFYDYIKINKKTKIYLNFISQLSQEYQNRLHAIVNEIIAMQNHDYKVPNFKFSGIDVSSSNTLLKLFLR